MIERERESPLHGGGSSRFGSSRFSRDGSSVGGSSGSVSGSLEDDIEFLPGSLHLGGLLDGLGAGQHEAVDGGDGGDGVGEEGGGCGGGHQQEGEELSHGSGR